jgi:hypothetical protein
MSGHTVELLAAGSDGRSRPGLIFRPAALSLRGVGGTYTGEGEHKAVGGADGLGQALGPGARL